VIVDLSRLQRLLGGNELSWLVQRIRRRMERGEPLDGAVTLARASTEQRDAVQRLLGRKPRAGTGLSVSLASVDEVVRRSGACPDGLPAAIVALTGPVTDRAAESAAVAAAWDQAYAPVAAVAGAELAEWLAEIRASGLVRRLAGSPEAAASLLADLATVLAALPASGEPLGHFAARTLRHAHDLDDDRPLTTLVLSAIRWRNDLPDADGAESRRAAWASVGLLRDELSSTVLTLGIPGDQHSATGRVLDMWRDAGEPVVLTLRHLVRSGPRLDLHGQTVSVCENPVVVSIAADRLGVRCGPLVCTRGQPGAAVTHLLRTILDAGADLRYHGDFDWGGLRVANVIFSRFPARPWHFTTSDYVAAAATWTGRALSGPPVPASWDADLATEMARLGTAIDEEHVIDTLIDDLAQ
jgi:uncharacterized protein (TIGR02679 family)